MEAPTSAPERWREKLKDSDVWEARPALNELFSIEHEGCNWLVVTTGHILMAEASSRPGAQWQGDAAGLQAVMTPGDERHGSVPVADLIAWAGPPEYPRGNGCLACKGKGWVSHDCNCDLCEEDSEKCYFCNGENVSIEVGPRLGRLFGHLFNRNLIAQAIAEVTYEEVEVRIKRKSSGSFVYFLTPTERIVVVGMLELADVKRDAPGFPAEASS